MTYYGYAKCGTCRAALKALAAAGVTCEVHDITTEPPPRELLAAIVAGGSYQLKDLFNRSGQLYREMQLKDKLKTMTAAAQLDLLAAHGKLIKRPIITDGKRCTVGYQAEIFAATWGL